MKRWKTAASFFKFLFVCGAEACGNAGSGWRGREGVVRVRVGGCVS